MLPCLIFEDEHLLVVNKPAGLNTHAPSPYAGEGIYDWLRNRDPRWADLAIIHRLDKETSGVLVFSKSQLANRSLTEQFTNRLVKKKYLLLTDRSVKPSKFTAKTTLIRAGEKFVSCNQKSEGVVAETCFDLLPSRQSAGGFSNLACVEAWPLTGRTHQIRVHAAENGFPVLGDGRYDGTPASRLFLHAAEITLRHPESNEEKTFCAPAAFQTESRGALRAALIDPNETSAYRIIQGGSDGWRGLHVDRLGDFLLSDGESGLSPQQQDAVQKLATTHSSRGVYHKVLDRHIRRAIAAESSAQSVTGEPAPDRFAILENGVSFELSLTEGYSTGLFLDQRDNRRRLLSGYIAPNFAIPLPSAHVLNIFAYTCGFSVCAAKSGATTTSLDLSKKYLEWGKRNFSLNELDPGRHNFIYGDAFEWLRRLRKRSSLFDLIVTDPPTFSQSREYGVFRVEKNYGELISAVLPLLKPEGILLASTNAADWKPEAFLETLRTSIQSAGRKISQLHYSPQPPDFPISREEPAYLKTVWLRIK